MNYQQGDPGFEAGSETSREAALAIQADAATLRTHVFRAVVRAMPEGITCDELEVQLGMSHQTCSARCTELKRLGTIAERRVDGALVKRPTRSGRNAAVLFIPAFR